MLAGARFCRRCGQASRPFDRSSVTEAETKVFQSTREPQLRTQYHEPRPTGPSYLSPNEHTIPDSFPTTELGLTRVKRHGVLWAIAAIVFLLILFGGVMALRWSRSSSAPVPSTIIETPPQSGIAPPVPPQPPQPPKIEMTSGNGLIYPGAEVTMEMTRGNEGSIRQLKTRDSVEKVIAWYTEKLKPAKIIKTPESAVLSGDRATAVISSDDGETNVVLKEGIDR